jgi:hypothetical protein
VKINSSKINISKEKLDVNVSFYFFLKHLVKLKLSDIQAQSLYIELLRANNKLTALENFKQTLKKSKKKADEYNNILENIDSNTVELFVFALQLYMIKDLLLNEANLAFVAKQEELELKHPLSLAYDRLSLLVPYTKRVNGALLSLMFFEKLENNDTNFISQATQDYLVELSKKAINLKNKGLESNQIFMLMFNESINQSIISDSGYNYEQRVLKVLTDIGIPESTIQKTHDDQDKSTEYDFKFTYQGKTFGIGAKKTLRERYKQFIKTARTTEIDVTIEITIGLDLNEEKAKTIAQHDTVLFISDEIYQQREFFKTMNSVYSVKDLTLDTLKKIANIK